MNKAVSMEELPSDFFSQFEALSDAEEKLRLSISFMRTALAQAGTPNFKGFWEARKLCLPIFKEPLPGPVRSQLWNEYIDMTREGRRLKDLLDEESAFAVEQIDLAIQSLEKEITIFSDDIQTALKSLPAISFPENCRTLEERFSYYQTLQKKLSALNIHASRISGLRKELIEMKMRIRQKNQFFQRLSQLGDKVFPVRKAMIKEVSDAFTEDVSQFIEKYFSSNFSHDFARRSLFFLREEIKSLQATAKILTLNTQAFSATRKNLSVCWDQLKGMEKELKKEFAEQKQKSGENVSLVQEKIQAFSADYAEGKYTLEEGYKKLDTISQGMRNIELTRQHVYSLKEELTKAAEPLDEKRDEEEKARLQKQAEFEQARREKVEQFKERIDALFEKISVEEVAVLLGKFEEYRKDLSALSVTKIERQQLDRKLKTIRDQIANKQEQALIDLSDDDRAALDQLISFLSVRKERRKEVKAQIEDYRKITGGSDLDFEKAMRMQELLHLEKENLIKLDEGIAEIEKKIQELKKMA